MSATVSLSEPLQPNDAEVILAREAGRVLANLAGQDGGVRVEATETTAGRTQSVKLPPAAVRLLVDVLAQIAAGHAVAVVPTHAELTTQQAAGHAERVAALSVAERQRPRTNHDEVRSQCTLFPLCHRQVRQHDRLLSLADAQHRCRQALPCEALRGLQH